MPNHARSIWFLIAFLAAGSWLATASAWAGDGRFGAGEEIPVPTLRTVAVGDFNEDGLADLAAVSSTGGHVVVRLGRAGGGFTPAPDVAVGTAPEVVVVADFDADGHDDLAVTRPLDKKVSVRMGKGDGTFRATSPPDITLARRVGTLVVGDFNGDADEDLAIGTADNISEALVVRLGEGDATFTDGGQLNVLAVSMAVADFNADGIEDLAVGTSASTQRGRVLIGKGDGRFEIGSDLELPPDAGSHRALVVGDFDSDGHQDVAAAVGFSDVVSVRLGRGNGRFGAGPDVRAGRSPHVPTVGDFNADGNEDLAVANAGDGSVSVRLGDGAGGFHPARDVAAGIGPLGIATADFDGDGNDDLAVANVRGSVSVRPGLGTPALAGNLLANGGFEGPGAARTETQTRLPAVPGWERRGGMTYMRYGLPSHAYYPSRLAAPRYLGGGLGLLWGGNSAATDGVTEAFQTVDVSASAASIDAGRATTQLSAHLGGAVGIGDRMAARAEFLSGDDTRLGSFTIGPVTAADRHNVAHADPARRRRAGAGRHAPHPRDADLDRRRPSLLVGGG